jgi:hypothetical protein
MPAPVMVVMPMPVMPMMAMPPMMMAPAPVAMMPMMMSVTAPTDLLRHEAASLLTRRHGAVEIVLRRKGGRRQWRSNCTGHMQGHHPRSDAKSNSQGEFEKTSTLHRSPPNP